MGAAQELMASLLKERWGPAFREMGFRGSGNNWTLPDDRYWATFGFQSSHSSTGAEVKFALNYTVRDRAEWQRIYEAAPWNGPVPRAISGDRYMPGGVDHWWRLTGDGRNADQVSTEVLAAVRDDVLPELRRRMV